MEQFNSASYWEKRYASGGNSGAGSHNAFAEFKSSVINQFVVRNNIDTVIEFGCGDGNQLSYANYKQYTGIDVSETAVDICKKKFSTDSNKKFFLAHEAPLLQYDLALSLDVIYHLIEDSVFEQYIHRLFDASSKYVIIYSSDTDDNSDIKVSHVKHRNFTKYAEENIPEWQLFEKLKIFIRIKEII